METRLVVSSPVLGRCLFSLHHRKVVSMIMKCLLGLRIGLPEVILGLSERAFWWVEVKVSLAPPFLFCSFLHYFSTNDSISISPLLWSDAAPPAPPLFSKTSCPPAAWITSASSIFEVYIWWDFSGSKKVGREGDSSQWASQTQLS